MDGIYSILFSESFKAIMNYLKENFSSDLPKATPKLKIENHLKEIDNWSKIIQLYGMTNPIDTIKNTVELDFRTIPRRFKSSSKNSPIIIEKNLLNIEDNYVILGDPGAGKTTVIKRLVQKFLHVKKTAKDKRLPILILLRTDYTFDTSLFRIIAEKLGIPFERKKVEKKVRKPSKNEPQDEDRIEYEVIIEVEYYVGNKKLDDVIPNLLDKANTVLFIDGIDELSSETKTNFERDLNKISLRTAKCCILTTCRSGAYFNQPMGFSTLEICELNEEDFLDIINLVCDNVKEFLKEVETKPYYDLINRPLFLVQLIIFFNNSGYLPNQPSEVSDRIITLMLEKWDLQQGVKRSSKYSGFYPPQKGKFLSALSYYITYKIKTKVFNRENLIEAYQKMHQRFNLPKGESHIVVDEIESHTGIIVKGGDFYEFSHLSLQEYLCAKYIANEPVNKLIVKYLDEYPDPVAIAVVISSDSSNWFSSIILNNHRFFRFNKNLITFLRRLLIEKPYFSKSKFLGFAIIKLLNQNKEQINEIISVFLTQEGAKESLAFALSWYSTKSFEDSYLDLKISYGLDNKEYEGFSIPESANFEKSFVDPLINNGYLELIENRGEILFHNITS